MKTFLTHSLRCSIGFLTLALLAPWTRGAPLGGTPHAQPNIVVVIVDDLRREGISASGDPLVRTPNIDRLAREGGLFTHMYVTTSLCGPSRASFLTGEYVHRHLIKSNEEPNAVDDHNLITFPMLLQKQGYVTGMIGKWHLGPGSDPRPGFDFWCVMPGQGRYDDPELNTNGTLAVHPGYVTDILTQEALDFIGRQHDRPFFLWLAHKAPHEPATAAARHQHLYDGLTPPDAPSLHDDLSGKPMLRRPEALAHRQSERDTNNQFRQFATMAAVDEGVGRIYHLLEETGELDNTIFIFTSDNGWFWGEHGLNAKRAAYEESIGIPLLIRYPKLVKAGSVYTELALNIDVAPTLLDLAGVPVPDFMQGHSWRPLLSGCPPAHWRQDFLVEYWKEQRFPRIATLEAVRTLGNEIYITYPGHPDWSEYYLMNSDPYQLHNLIGDPKYHDRVDQLEKRLQILRAR